MEKKCTMPTGFIRWRRKRWFNKGEKLFRLKMEEGLLHTVEKIGGTSMSDYTAVRDNIVLNNPAALYQRIFVVSAYGGLTDLLLENKRNGKPGIYGFFANTDNDAPWQDAFAAVRQRAFSI